MRKIFSYIVFLFFTVLVSSCSGDDYVNVIPGNSTAIASVDLQKLSGMSASGADGASLMSALLGTDDAGSCGIDLGRKIYMFESADGNLGLVAKVSSDGNLEKVLAEQNKKGKCAPFTERKGYKFTLLNGSWVLGFSSDALMVMGPVVASQQQEVQLQMVRYLGQDEEKGIKGTLIFDKIDSIAAPVALVAQAAALPDKLALPLMLGAPKDADASQVMVAAGMTAGNGCLNVDCNVFSFNRSIDAAMREAWKTYRPVDGKFVRNLPSDAMAGMFFNVDGSKFIELLHANKGLQALLTGINMAIDMDNIIRCIDGDVSLVVSGYGGDVPDLRMAAQLGSRDFLSDVDYWKKSCPAGSRIDAWGKDAYYYTNGSLSYYFGVSDDNIFYSGSTSDKAKASVAVSSNPYGESVLGSVKGSRMCVILSLSSILGGSEYKDMLCQFIHPLFGDVGTVLVKVDAD